jgi:catalase
VATIYEDIVDAMNELSGVHPGYRAAHAKGILCGGAFTAAPDASLLSRAPHLAGDPVSAMVRFSNGGGDPNVPDTARLDGRGMATRFLSGGDATSDIVAITIPVFFVRTANDFLDFIRARKPDPETGELDMEKVGAFVAQHPETQAALEHILPSFVPPASYGQCAYNSLHAFGLVNADGEKQFVRYRWEPEAGEAALSDDEVEASSPDYLQEELRERLDREAVVFTLTAKLAAEGDPLDDPTVPWPDDREVVELGRLEVTELLPPEEEGDELLVFDPTRVCDGIECSDDEILMTRPKAYAVSAERRAAARKVG